MHLVYSPIRVPYGMAIRTQDEAIRIGDKFSDKNNELYGPVPKDHKLVGRKVATLPLGHACFKPIHTKPEGFVQENRRLLREIALSTRDIKIV